LLLIRCRKKRPKYPPYMNTHTAAKAVNEHIHNWTIRRVVRRQHIKSVQPQIRRPHNNPIASLRQTLMEHILVSMYEPVTHHFIIHSFLHPFSTRSSIDTPKWSNYSSSSKNIFPTLIKA
jgi:hypothetical protein